MSKTTFKQVLLGEARRDDLEYTEEKTKGVVDKVITELKGSESAVATKLASELKKLMAEVNASKDFDGIKMTLDRDISTTAGPNNMAGKMTAKFKFTLPFDAATDYTKKHVEFYGLSSEEVGQRYPHIFRDLGEQKMYGVLKKVYAYFDKKFDGKLSWSYQRAFGDKKAKYTIEAFAQVLITPASVTEGQAVGWYVENKDGKTVAGPMAEAAAKKKAQELGGDAKGFSATYVSDYDAKRMCESLDADELFDKFIDANRMYSFEGSRGVSNLEKLIRVLGYRDLHEFFSDNSGAIEGVVEWIKEWTERNDEWKQALLDEVGGEEDNQ